MSQLHKTPLTSHFSHSPHWADFGYAVRTLHRVRPHKHPSCEEFAEFIPSAHQGPSTPLKGIPTHSDFSEAFRSDQLHTLVNSDQSLVSHVEDPIPYNSDPLSPSSPLNQHRNSWTTKAPSKTITRFSQSATHIAQRVSQLLTSLYRALSLAGYQQLTGIGTIIYPLGRQCILATQVCPGY